MTEDRFDELMRDAERTYRNPPQPDFDAMWKSIEGEPFGAPGRTAGFRLASRWIGIAATLIVGIGIGRASMSLGRPATQPAPSASTVAVAPTTVHVDSTMSRPY